MLTELYDVFGPRGEAPEGLPVPGLDPELVLAHVRDHRLASLRREVQTEVAELISCADMTALIPAVEVPHQRDRLGEEEGRGGGDRE